MLSSAFRASLYGWRLHLFGQHESLRACVDSLFKMASAKSAKQRSPQKSRGISWKNGNVQLLLEVMKEETIVFSLDNAKTPKEKRAAYENVAVKLQNKGKIYYLRFYYYLHH